MEEFEQRYLEVMVAPDQLVSARALKPIQTRQVFGREIMLFDLSLSRVERDTLAGLGDIRTPSIGDLFVAVMTTAQGNSYRNFSSGAAQ
jgi:ABC-2 type transport system ATP-binding protein